ncbi:reverse transcriptase [Dictyobacter sp. S3.2.2.5]|uniref:Reverse transcriptase n=1 Tax=Dictyobacter halimunensis TaxID=3026934 RepID=A0ABQ6FMX8_9CHLR|nr:reverse transcriptase [Dictyobacter sp. S3.2.2.5]
MSQKIPERLEALRKLNSSRQWVNNDLYRLMFKEDLYIIAYERIKSKPGNMTPGTDGETIDGFSLSTVREIIEAMRSESFRFQPVRQSFIPKANGKMRKLGIPSAKDKIVQQAIYTILEAIYDSPQTPYFCETSHGFRPNHSCHTALREIREAWSAVNWFIEGDIRSCFDEVDHQTLVSILRKKIKDERFLNLIWKLLNAGYMDLHGARKDSLVGTPQGSIASPILANVYLHELDEFVETLRTKREKGKVKARNPLYHQLSEKKRRMAKQGKTRTREFRELVKRLRTLPSVVVDDPHFTRLKYLRYADDWIIGLCGSRKLADEIKQEMKDFLKEKLKLTLSEEKTRITNAKAEEAFFLGTILKIGNGENAKVTLCTSRSGKKVKRRSTGWETVMEAPMPKLTKRLSERGFCTAEGFPIAKAGWAYLDTDQIINLYSSINRGIQNYYAFVDNWSKLSRIQYILRYSLAKTLAMKHKISLPKVFKRFGKNLTIVIKGKEGKKDREVSFHSNQNWSKDRDAFQGSTAPNVDRVRMATQMRTRSKLGLPCCICGESAEQIVMHHVRHIRKLSHRREPTGFNRILRKINRKQIPVCGSCHGKIHRGEYDAVKLTDLAYIPS